MALGEGAAVDVRLRDREVGARERLEQRPLALQRAVVRRLDDAAVERHVGARLVVVVLALGAGAHRGEQRVELRELRVRDARGGLLRRERLEHGAHGVGLEQLLLGEVPNGAAAIWLVVHASELLEIAQRLAHRRLAALQLARDLRLHEALARRIGAGQDALQDELLDLVAQDDFLQRCHGAASPYQRARRTANAARGQAPSGTRRGRNSESRPAARTNAADAHRHASSPCHW